MTIFQSIAKLSLILACLFGLCLSECEYGYFSRQDKLCYGMTSNASSENCKHVGSNVSFIWTMAMHPITDQFYIIAALNNTGDSETGLIHPFIFILLLFFMLCDWFSLIWLSFVK